GAQTAPLDGRTEPTILGGAARLADGTLAGSIVTMLGMVRIMRQYTNIDARGIMHAGSYNAAWVLGELDRGNLLAGSHADLLLFDRCLELKAVFVNGQEIT